jgi:hypothetical protein
MANGKKKKKGSAKKKGGTRRAMSNAHAGVVELMSDKNVLMGAAVGAGSALVVDIAYNLMGKNMPEFMRSPIVQAGVSALAPALLSGFILKDKEAVKAATAVGLAGGLVAIAGDAIKGMFNKSSGTLPAAPAKTALTGGAPMVEDVYSQVNGELGRGESVADYQEVSGDDDISGAYDEVSGDDDISGASDEINGGMYDSLSGDDDINGEAV